LEQALLMKSLFMKGSPLLWFSVVMETPDFLVHKIQVFQLDI